MSISMSPGNGAFLCLRLMPTIISFNGIGRKSFKNYF